MIQHHKWSLNELEDMLAWEREIYLNLLSQNIKKEKAEYEKQEKKNRS